MRFHFLLPDGTPTNAWSLLQLWKVLKISKIERKQGVWVWVGDRLPPPDPKFVHLHTIEEAKSWLLSSQEPIEILCFNQDVRGTGDEGCLDLIAWMETVLGLQHHRYDRWPMHVAILSRGDTRIPVDILRYDRDVRVHVLPKHMEAGNA